MLKPLLSRLLAIVIYDALGSCWPKKKTSQANGSTLTAKL